MRAKLPFVSVVVICYNGEATLRAALKSLLDQTYPKNCYEVIVVDDGSTDKSVEVATTYPSVKLIKLGKNKGIPSARNAGLQVAKGTLYASFDCDCKADPDWLHNLVQGFQIKDAIGIGSVIVEPEPITRLATRYISTSDSLFVPVIYKEAVARKNPLQRLIRYIWVRVKTTPVDNQPRKVTDIYGAGGCFSIDTLRSVGGWDESLHGIEDRDLSKRLKTAFPEKQFYVEPNAKIVHERGESLWQYLTRPVKRGAVNYEFHQKNHIAPPIFPFPLAFLLLSAISAVLAPLLAVALVVLLPQLLYFWWPIKALQRRQSLLLLFPYIQLLEEFMVIVGLADGLIKSLQRRQRNA